jgi:hypothetical protein
VRKPLTDSRFGELSKYFEEVMEDRYIFDNGLVHAEVDAWDDGVINILEWGAYGPPRQGNTRKSLEQLREFFVGIDVSGIFEKDDPEAPAAWYCWQQMLNEGLIDAAYEQNGAKLKKSSALKP